LPDGPPAAQTVRQLIGPANAFWVWWHRARDPI